jgi:WhiB family redox-sensing transcriptional regulator
MPGTRTSAPRGAATTPSNPLEGVGGEARIAWVSRARCRGADPDELFVRGAAQRKAAVICRHCPVIAECGADALDNRVEFGVWGGMTERERRALLRRRPDVTSWRDLLESAKNEYERTNELIAG